MIKICLLLLATLVSAVASERAPAAFESEVLSIKDDALKLGVTVAPDTDGGNASAAVFVVAIENLSSKLPYKFRFSKNPAVTFMLVIRDSSGNPITKKIPILRSHEHEDNSFVEVKPNSVFKLKIPIASYLMSGVGDLIRSDQNYRWHLAIVISTNPTKVLHFRGEKLRL